MPDERARAPAAASAGVAGTGGSRPSRRRGSRRCAGASGTWRTCPRRFLSRNSTRLNCEPTETISARALLGGDQHRHVLAGARRRHELVRQAELLRGARAPARARRGRRGRRARRRSAASASLRGVHVADDHVRREALLEQRVRAAVDADEHRAHVADVRAQRAQVALVVDAAHDDQRGPVAEVGVEARQLDACPASSSRSSSMCSIVLCANASSASPISRAALGRSSARTSRRAPGPSPLRDDACRACSTSPPRTVDRVAVVEVA